MKKITSKGGGKWKCQKWGPYNRLSKSNLFLVFERERERETERERQRERDPYNDKMPEFIQAVYTSN